MSDYLPLYDDADGPFTVTLSGTVVGGQVITCAGAAAGAASPSVLGVAGQDGVSGAKITVWGPTKHVGTASGTIAVGDPLCTGAAGTLRTFVAGTDVATAFIARALTAATTGQPVTYSLFGV